MMTTKELSVCEILLLLPIVQSTFMDIDTYKYISHNIFICLGNVFSIIFFAIVLTQGLLKVTRFKPNIFHPWLMGLLFRHGRLSYHNVTKTKQKSFVLQLHVFTHIFRLTVRIFKLTVRIFKLVWFRVPYAVCQATWWDMLTLYTNMCKCIW